MLDSTSRHPALPAAPGVGYKPQHFAAITEDSGPVEWLEVHAENYMGAGGRPIAQLRHLAERFAFSVHGVGLSIGGEGRLDPDHLARLAHLCGWLQPASFSEHLAWSTHDSHFLNDLLPLPYTGDTLASVADHIDELQEAIGRTMLLENPSSYLAFDESTRSETDFLAEVARRTGCGLLLDVNNVFISATNLGYSPQGYIDAFPLDRVGEIHLGGHDEDADDHGAPLLIDSHGREVADPVWALLDHTLRRSGPRPILIEWDADIPDWPVLAAEAARAADALARGTGMNVSQDRFRDALLDARQPVPGGLSDGAGRPAGSRFSVYRNNVAVSLTEALELGFPALHGLLGDDTFKAVMGRFLRQHPPDTPMISHYGAALPGFLAGFEPLQHLGYLPDVARLELALRQSYHAADAAPIDPAALQALAPDALMAARFDLAPALRIVRSDWPVHGIWAYKMQPGAPKAVQEAQKVLIMRPEFDPEMTVIDAATDAFVTALGAGETLGAAHDAAAGTDPDFDLSRALTLLLGGQALTRIITETTE